MSRVTTYTCDHCGAKVSPFIGEQWAASILTVGPNMPDVHGCSKEHLGFALAKAFGVPIDVDLERRGKGDTHDLTGPKKPTKPLYEQLSHEALFDAYTKPLRDMGFAVVAPRSVHWGTVTEVLQVAIDRFVAPLEEA